ncbi:hypothetical protein PHMEG_00015586 [Phytophthora megakarya]|uniref:Uncharacterized protein n=1 Tax=Phytophthora megakarya TaxID=4795 RepID=A0A225W1X9_9STRA|nr:hypothetical protein PHMEG_00015586 [Phytophthora megakarya]
MEECWYRGPGIDLGDSIFLCWDESLAELVPDKSPEAASEVPLPEPSQSTEVEVTSLPESERLKKDCSEDMSPKYGRLFLDAELDAMEAGEPAEEKEYDEDLEDRLYPLDEVGLLRRRVKNAEAQREPSMTEVALQLGLPLEKLQRNRNVLSGG